MKIFLLILLLIVSNSIAAQNLVSNGGFETYSALPTNVGQYANATGWSNCGGNGTPDYFHMNGSGIVDLPVCFIGTLYPYSGDGIMGFCSYYHQQTPNYREYITTQLTSALITGASYNVSFYISCGINSGSYCGQGIDRFSVDFSVGPLTQPGTGVITSVTPQWTTPGILYDTGWVQITFQFTAADAYDHIAFGNFVDDLNTNVQTFVPALFPGAYYFLDEIEVQQGSLLAFNATDTSLCQKFCISFYDSSQNNPTSWQWIFPGGAPSSSTLQNPPSICYDVPGTYDVTLITTNANGTDTLTLPDYITVYPTPPFPTITQVGYTLTSSVSSSYQWQFNSADIPGATNQSYTILQTGYYTVVVGDENGCVNSFTVYVLISGIGAVNSDAGISIYPNPSSGNFMVEFSCAKASENGWLNGLMPGEVSIDIVNTLGQIVFISTDKIAAADGKKEIDLHNTACGVYFIEIKTANTFMRKKIIVEK